MTEPYHRNRAGRVQVLATTLGLAVTLVACDRHPTNPADADPRRPLDPQMVAEGQDIFRYDTFGNEVFWTDAARMHEVIAGSVSPALALAVGLKVDADALPQAVKDAIAAGRSISRTRLPRLRYSS